MSSDPELPDWVDLLRGDGGGAWRALVLVGLCTLAVLALTGMLLAVR